MEKTGVPGAVGALPKLLSAACGQQIQLYVIWKWIWLGSNKTLFIEVTL